MRKRQISPDFWSDEKVNELSLEAILLFEALWSMCSDWGLMRYSPTRIRREILPDKRLDVPALVAEIKAAGMIVLYTVDKQDFLCVKNFRRYQANLDKRASKALPPPYPLFYQWLAAGLDPAIPFDTDKSCTTLYKILQSRTKSYVGTLESLESLESLGSLESMDLSGGGERSFSDPTTAQVWRAYQILLACPRFGRPVWEKFLRVSLAWDGVEYVEAAEKLAANLEHVQNRVREPLRFWNHHLGEWAVAGDDPLDAEGVAQSEIMKSMLKRQQRESAAERERQKGEQ